jgi:hypothetical protein
VYESYESIHSKIDSSLRETEKSDISNGQYNEESTRKIESKPDHIDGISDDINVGTPNMPKNSDISPLFDKNQEIGIICVYVLCIFISIYMCLYLYICKSISMSIFFYL